MTLCAESPDTGQVARGMVRSALEDWGLAELVDDVQLAASELVGNVVHHAVPDECLASPGAPRQLDVTLTKWPKWLLLGVMDEDSSSPTIPMGETFSPRIAASLPEALLPDRGRGLLIVHSLADALWWTPNESGGKTVVCRFDLDGRPTDGSGEKGRLMAEVWGTTVRAGDMVNVRGTWQEVKAVRKELDRLGKREVVLVFKGAPALRVGLTQHLDVLRGGRGAR